MAQYPDIDASDELSVELLRSMLPQIYVKGTLSTKGSNTYSSDSELSGIALPVGTFLVKLHLYATCGASATPDIKTTWTFTGTWNNPLRGCFGPGAANTAAPSAATPIKMTAQSANSDSIYGMAASAAYTYVTETSYNVTVTVAGNLALAWAQNTTDAVNVTTVQAGSAFHITQLA